MFVGRLEELTKLESALLQTRAGQPVNFMLTGERGIGKTSLLEYIKDVASGHFSLSKVKTTFLVIETDVDENTTQLGLVRKIELGLRRELGESEQARSFLSSAWEFLKRVEACGVSLKGENAEDEELIIEEFAYSLAETVNRLTTTEKDGPFDANYDGLLLLIDEADNASGQLNLGSFAKLLIERLQRHDCEKFMIGIAGLPELRQVLYESHPSSLRIFEEVPLGRLSEIEVEQVINLCLQAASNKNEFKTTISADAVEVLVKLSEGYPHFIQQFGYCAFAADDDGQISREDVLESALGTAGSKRGALEIIGDTYYRTDFYNKIQKESYREVLRIMANKHDGWVTKAEIKSSFSGKESTLDNAIQALRDRHIILSKEGERGVYRLQHRGFAAWIKLYTQQAASEGPLLPFA